MFRVNNFLLILSQRFRGSALEDDRGGVTWSEADGNLPDVPTDDLVITASGTLVLGTDLGVVISTDGGAHWQRLGSNHPYTTVMDLHAGPDGKLYSATYGRGIWSIRLPA